MNDEHNKLNYSTWKMRIILVFLLEPSRMSVNKDCSIATQISIKTLYQYYAIYIL